MTSHRGLVTNNLDMQCRKKRLCDTNFKSIHKLVTKQNSNATNAYFSIPLLYNFRITNTASNRTCNTPNPGTCGSVRENSESVQRPRTGGWGSFKDSNYIQISSTVKSALLSLCINHYLRFHLYLLEYYFKFPAVRVFCSSSLINFLLLGRCRS